MRTTLLLCALAVHAPAASAADAVIAKLQGKVQVKAEGTEKWLKAKEGAELLFGDAVRVPKKGVAHIRVGDTAVVLVRGDSELVVGGSADRPELGFSFGEFLIGLGKKLAKGRTFAVRTPSAVASVRGTLFWGRSDKKTKESVYAGFGGVVTVEAQGKTVEVRPGRKVVVGMGQPPAEPAESGMTLEAAKGFALDGSLQGLEALAKADEPEPAPAPKRPRRGKKETKEPKE